MHIRTQNRSWISGVPGRLAAALALPFILLPTTGCPLFGGGSSSSTGSGSNGQSYTESVLYSFAGVPDGANPYSAGLVLDAQGNLYGATVSGGDASCTGNIGTTGCGTVFKLNPAGQETILHTFTGSPGGEVPYAGLVLDSQGNLYGTTAGGGVHNNGGTVFKVDATGNETILYSFCAAGVYPYFCTDGNGPEAGLVLDPQGNLYGTTAGGGASGNGTVFKLSTAGVQTVLHSFTGSGGDGAMPFSSLALDAQGNLYGTTYIGGDLSCSNLGSPGCGTVFKVDASGNETVLYSFPWNAILFAGVVLDAQGNLYGATGAGGTPLTGCGGGGCGTIFKIDSAGNQSILDNLGTQNGGWGPYGTLVMDAQDNLYGTTFGGSSAAGQTGVCQYGCGTVFAIDKAGNQTVLYNFKGGTDGLQPDAALVLDAQGNLFGTTRAGGASGNGIVFKLTP